MACKAEKEFTKTLIWSKKEYSLSEFTTEYPLPQVVRVVEGYYSENEDSCVGAHQVLALHAIHATPKVVGNNCFGKPVAIPLGCTTKAVVHPLKCKNVNCTAADLKSVYPKMKFVRVESCDIDVGSNDRGDQSIEVDDLLKITNIDKKRKLVDFQNVDTGRLVSLDYAYPATFTPLLDSRRYSIAEIKKIYGFPARVRFLSEDREVGIRWNRNMSTVGRRGLTNNTVSSLGVIVLVEETTETTVISTTVGGESEEKLCIGLPKDLPINVAVAEGFLQGGGNYEEIVTTLHKKFKVTNLGDFDLLNVYQHVNAVRKFNFLNTENEPVVPARPLPSSPAQQFPKSSTKITGKVVLPATSVDDEGSYELVDTSEQREHAYMEFFCERPAPRSSPNGQKDPPNIQNPKISPSTKYEKSSTTSSFGGDLRRLLHDQNEDMYERISQIPEDLLELTVDDVAEVLKCLRMDAYVETFDEEMIDGPMLKDLDIQTLESLNVTLFHGKKLKKFINGWRPRKGQPVKKHMTKELFEQTLNEDLEGH